MSGAIIWIDSEFSGTSPQSDSLLEIAAVITDLKGKQIGYHFESLFDVANLSQVISESSEIVREMHDRSGLWLDLWSSKTRSLRNVQEALLEWIESTVSGDTVLYFGGNSITKDRNFVEVNLPRVYERISHQSVDVTSIAIALKAVLEVQSFTKDHEHRALADVKESIEEYRHYTDLVKSFSKSHQNSN